MCTVTYLPLKPDEFILTSSRDERTERDKAYFPKVDQFYDRNILYPKDGQASGTWIAASSRGRTICLLNGAFNHHIPNPPYRKSRGLVVLDAIETPLISSFIDSYDLSNIEPFTMIIIDKQEEAQTITEFRWDGRKKYVIDKEISKPHIWSSVTLYEPEIIKAREQWFDKWLSQNTSHSIEMSRAFHFKAGQEDPRTGVMMNRDNVVKTVSVTTVSLAKEQIKMIYQDTEDLNILEHHLKLNQVGM